MTPLNCNLKLSPCHFALLMFLNQRAKKGVTGVIDSDNRGETGLLPTMEVRKSECKIQVILRTSLSTSMPCD